MRPLRDCFPVILKEIARKPELALILLQELWAEIVGEGVAENLAPVALDGGRLTLEARAEGWDSCTDLAPMIAGRVNAFWGCGLVERIRIVSRQS